MLTIMTEAYTTDLFLLAWLFSLWIWKMGKKNSLSILTLILTISLQKGLLKLVILLHLHLKESYSLLRSALYFSWHYTQCFLQDICISHHRRQENNNRKSLLCKTWSIKKKKITRGQNCPVTWHHCNAADEGKTIFNSIHLLIQRRPPDHT